MLRLLSKDKQGNLNASRVLQLERMADESDNDQFKEGVKIIKKAICLLKHADISDAVPR